MRGSNVTVDQSSDEEVVLTYTDQAGRIRKQRVALSGSVAPQDSPSGQQKQTEAKPGTGQSVGTKGGPDTIGDAIAQTTTRSVAKLDKLHDMRLQQATSERVKRDLYNGLIPNSADLNLLGFNSASEAEAAMTVGGLSPREKVRQVRDRNLAASGSTLDEKTGLVTGPKKKDPLAAAVPEVAPKKISAPLVEDGKVLSVDGRRIYPPEWKDTELELKQSLAHEVDPVLRRDLEQRLQILKEKKQSRLVSGFTWDGLTSV